VDKVRYRGLDLMGVVRQAYIVYHKKVSHVFS